MKPVYSIMSLSFLTILLLVTPVIGSSDDWVEYGISYDDNVYFYNKVNIKRTTKDIVQVWGKVVFSKEGREQYIQKLRYQGMSTEGYDKLSHNLDLEEIDCKNQMYKFLSITHYDTEGRVLNSGSSDESNWSYISPDSTMDTLRKEVCK